MNHVRNSNIELLRIISMIMIVVLHYFNFGGILSKTYDEIGVNYLLVNLIESICIISVNVFVIITGFYMINKNEINIKKIINLIFSITIYGTLFFLIAIFLKLETFSIKSFVSNVAPMFIGLKWFILNYIFLYLLIPFINKLLNSLTKKDFTQLVIICLICFSVAATFFAVSPIKDNGYGIVNFVLLYMLGAYIKTWFEATKYKNTKLTIIIIISIMCINFMSYFIKGRAWGYNNIFNIIASVCLFLIFTNLKPRSNKIINSIARNTLGVYIIHTSEALRNFYYFTIMKCDQYYNSQYLVLHMIICVLVSYVVFTLIDKIKEMIFSKTIYVWIDKIKIFNYIIKVK